MVWSPLCAVALVLLGIPVPKEVDDMLALIGSTTSGVALFAAGLIIARPAGLAPAGTIPI